MAEKSTLLIVDDDQDNRALLKKSLPDDLYQVVEAENGTSVIGLLKNNLPDLIILDVLMPDIDGFETCRQIRKTDVGKYIPVIIMTSLGDTQSIEKAYEVGASNFITKPFNPTLLNYEIKFLLKSKRTSDELRNTQLRLETAQRIAKLGHWEWTFTDNKIIWSEEICHIIGFPGSQTSAISHQLVSRIHPEDLIRVKTIIKNAIREKTTYSIEYRIILPDGNIRTVLQDAEIFIDENCNPEKMIGTLQDITSRKQTEDKIKTLAYYNKVTGLPNRTLLKRLLNKYISKTDPKQPIAVLTITLDRFKLITDSYGHAFGENLIRKVAIRLIRSIKSSSYFSHKINESIFQRKNIEKPLTISHCDRDEFVVVLPQILEINDAALIARNITKALAEPCLISDQEIRVTASIGISVYPVDGRNTDTILKNSATALYHAKRQGGDGYKFFTAKMNARAFERLTLETSLRKAMEEEQFILYYQPKMSLSNNQLVGMEALLRWNHPELGLISPGEFINILEKTGLIVPLGEKILESTCTQIKQWNEQQIKPIPVAINLSPIQLRQKDFHLRLSRILKQTGIKPEMIELEITESTLMNNMDKSITMLKKLRLLGAHISLDDFGTGYSSLTYLKHFPVNTLKIDRSFIQNVTVDPDDAAIVKGVIALAHNLRLKVVAEGIEEQAQHSFLKGTGCDYGQGFHYSKPVDVSTFTNLFMKKENQQPFLISKENTGYKE